MQPDNNKKTLLIPAGMAAVLAGITLQYCALSSLELVKEAIDAVAGHQAAAPVLAALGGALATAAYFVAKAVKRNLEETLGSAGYGVTRSLFDTDLAQKLPRRGYWVRMFALGMVIVVFLCGLHWAAEGTWEMVAHHAHLSHWPLAGLAALATLGLAYEWRRSIRPEATHKEGTPGQFEALVLFLSSPGPNPLAHKVEEYKKRGSAMTTAEFLADFEDLMLGRLGRLPVSLEEAKKLFGRNSWAMPIGSLATVAQKGALRHVVLIGSRGAGDFQATRGLAENFAEVIGKVMGDSAPTFHPWPRDPGEDGIDFENFTQLKNTLADVHEFLEKALADSPTTRICVDITGGTKLCTIAGLVSTLRPGLNALYVSTSSFQLRAYDVQYVNQSDEPLPPHVPSLEPPHERPSRG